MSRELKFRIWDNTKSRWHHDSEGYIQDSEGIGLNELIIVINTRLMGDKPRSQRFIIQQFTGLKDKNGREIYEGDIITVSGDNIIVQVMFRDGCFIIQGDNKLGMTPLFMYSNLKILGNIFENKDLLK